ncbi:MAG TPA: ABC transporter permease [Candidatus Lustribacter sp.]|nr:ABC transporter permease [Candidatus Lustribacter sp.]
MALDTSLVTELKGLDALETHEEHAPLGARIWAGMWPKLAAVGLFLGLWEGIVLLGLKPEYVLPGPAAALGEFAHQLTESSFWNAVAVTFTRGVVGFVIAAAVGLVLGIVVAKSRILRTAIGSLITGLQTMPSIAWFPLAILLFQLTEQAILFVILIGAVPSIANGVIGGVDYVPTLLVRAGRNIGARGLALYRHVILPAALPSIVSGLKQGWAFAWRSLLAGELIVAIANRPSLGQFLSNSRELGDPPYMIALMIAILLIGVLVDAVFSGIDSGIRRRRGVLASR